MKKNEEPAWESLIGAKIEAHRGTYKPQRIEDSRKRNAARATKDESSDFNGRSKTEENQKA
jgi:hypothetical protein